MQKGFGRDLFDHIFKVSQNSNRTYMFILFRIKFSTKSYNMFRSSFAYFKSYRTLTKADIQQQLLHERQRLSSTKGVTMYLVTENRLIYQSHGRINYTDNMTDPGQMKRSSLTAGVVYFRL